MNSTKRSIRNQGRKPLSKKSKAYFISSEETLNNRSPSTFGIPRTMRLSLKNTYQAGIAGTAGATSFTNFGLIEFLTQTPAYLSELYAMYLYSKIHSCKVKVTVVNTSTVPIRVAAGPIPYAEAVAFPSLARIAEATGSFSGVLSAAGGIDKCAFSRTYHTEDLVKALAGDKWWMTSTQAASGTPLTTLEPVLCLTAVPFVSVNWTAVIIVDMIWDVTFFDVKSSTSA